MFRARPTSLLLFALPLVACGNGTAPTPRPEPSAKITAPETKPAPIAEIAPTASASAAPEAPPVTSAEPSAKVAPSATASAASAKIASNSGVNLPISLPKSDHGVLAAGVADKLLASGAPAIVRLLDPGAERRSDLSYAIAKGPAPKLTMAMDTAVSTAVSMKANEAELPQITMTLDGWAGEANAAGEWKILASFVDVGLEARSAQGAQMHAAL